MGFSLQCDAWVLDNILVKKAACFLSGCFRNDGRKINFESCESRQVNASNIKRVLYIEYQSFCAVVLFGASRPPTPANECSCRRAIQYIHTGSRKTEGGSNFAWVRGWGDPNRTTAQKLWYSICYTPCTIYV
jgi:hypothetical protein